MSDTQDKTISLNVRLKPIEHSDRPHTANHTNVGMAQGIAYLDFGFLEPALLGAIVKTAANGQPAPKELTGTLVTRVAMPLEALVRLHQQIQHILVGLRDASQVTNQS
ncbi:MAG TPA: hypothetical protein VJ746_14315 [Nitrospira sp.]|nr:hypothetical protein [Nitrospira sp.]